ncbi:hypothetical protein MMC10_000749 [Thelotrema lepadinum]|nr:hypothetical protein [Thelotrema lepadinum]
MEHQTPRPERFPCGYSVERVLRGKAYAEEKLKSKDGDLRPLAADVLNLYVGACTSYILASQNGFQGYTQWPLIEEISKYEHSLNERRWLAAAPQEEQEKAENELLALRKLQMYSRYSDYLVGVCHQLHMASEATGNQSLSSQSRWTILAPLLIAQNEERNDRRANLSKYDDAHEKRFPELESLEDAARTTSLRFDQYLRAVKVHGQRNEMARTDLEELAAHGDLGKIARALHSDLADIPAVLDRSLQTERTVLIAIIESIIDAWFTQPHGPTEPKSWKATEELYQQFVSKQEVETKSAKKAPGEELMKLQTQRKADRKRLMGRILQYAKSSLASDIELAPQLNMDVKRQWLLSRENDKNPRKQCNERMAQYKEIDLLGEKMARTYFWSMKKEKALQECMRDTADLRSLLNQKEASTNMPEWETASFGGLSPKLGEPLSNFEGPSSGLRSPPVSFWEHPSSIWGPPPDIWGPPPSYDAPHLTFPVPLGQYPCPGWPMYPSSHDGPYWPGIHPSPGPQAQGSASAGHHAAYPLSVQYYSAPRTEAAFYGGPVTSSLNPRARPYEPLAQRHRSKFPES